MSAHGTESPLIIRTTDFSPDFVTMANSWPVVQNARASMSSEYSIDATSDQIRYPRSPTLLGRYPIPSSEHQTKLRRLLVHNQAATTVPSAAIHAHQLRTVSQEPIAASCAPGRREQERHGHQGEADTDHDQQSVHRQVA